MSLTIMTSCNYDTVVEADGCLIQIKLSIKCVTFQDGQRFLTGLDVTSDYLKSLCQIRIELLNNKKFVLLYI